MQFNRLNNGHPRSLVVNHALKSRRMQVYIELSQSALFFGGNTSSRWFPSPFLPLSTVYQCVVCLSPLPVRGSWLGCQDLPAIRAVSIQRLTTKSGSSWMSHAPNLHLTMQLLKLNYVVGGFTFRTSLREFWTGTFFLNYRCSDQRLHQKQLTCVVDYWSIRRQQDSHPWNLAHTVSLTNCVIPVQNFQMDVNYPLFLISHNKVTHFNRCQRFSFRKINTFSMYLITGEFFWHVNFANFTIWKKMRKSCEQ